MRIAFRNFALLISTLIFSFQSYGTAAGKNIRKKPYPFHNGEVMNMVVYYNWGPIWLKAGEAQFTTSLEQYDGQTTYHFTATGKSLEKWDWLFKLRDYYQSYARTYDLHPLYYEKNTLEGGYMIHNRYFFYPEKRQIRIITEESRKPYRDTTVSVNHTIYDVLSAVYSLRAFDTDTISANDTISVPVILDGKMYTQNIIYKGKALLENRGEKVPALLYVALLTESSFFSGSEEIKVYVSDDKNRFPVYIRADIIIGSIKIFLKSYEELKVIESPD